jgi:hypothetical protein
MGVWDYVERPGETCDRCGRTTALSWEVRFLNANDGDYMRRFSPGAAITFEKADLKGEGNLYSLHARAVGAPVRVLLHEGECGHRECNEMYFGLATFQLDRNPDTFGDFPGKLLSIDRWEPAGPKALSRVHFIDYDLPDYHTLFGDEPPNPAAVNKAFAALPLERKIAAILTGVQGYLKWRAAAKTEEGAQALEGADESKQGPPR